jgi:L-ascorbate metabolism protein UlaG (beta-lactamase superfamily)
MGDIGQETLTEEQLEEIGPIDIAFMQFDNSFSSMSLKNMKGFNLIEQLNPKIIIPTHYAKADIALFDEKYGGVTEFENVLTVSAEDLPEDTMNVYMISNTHYYR